MDGRREKVIKGAEPEGTVFFQPGREAEKAASEEERQETILSKTRTEDLDTLWKVADRAGYQRGIRDGYQQGYESGRSEGFEVGLRKGIQIARNDLQRSVDFLGALAKEYMAARDQMYSQLKPELIRFCLAVSEALLRRKMENPEQFKIQVDKVLESAKSLLEEAPVTVWLAQEDLDMLQQAYRILEKENEHFKKISFAGKEGMLRGNFVLETPLGLVNFDIHRLLDELGKQALAT